MKRSVFNILAIALILMTLVSSSIQKVGAQDTNEGNTSPEAQVTTSCVQGPKELCVPVYWTLTVEGKWHAEAEEAMDGYNYKTCEESASDNVSGNYIISGTFTHPGSNWELIDGSGFTNQLSRRAHIYGDLSNFGINGFCPSYARARLEGLQSVPSFSDEAKGGVRHIDAFPSMSPLSVILPNQQPGTLPSIPFYGVLHAEVSYGTFPVSANVSVDLIPELPGLTWLKFARIPPSCQLTGTGFRDGRTYIEITVRDNQSGLAGINPILQENVSVKIPAFNQGTSNPVVVTATKVDQSLISRVGLQIFDQAGNATSCDPQQREF